MPRAPRRKPKKKGAGADVAQGIGAGAFKRRVVEAILRKLDDDAAVLRAQANATREAATHEESRPENDKDTRGLEASYLARGQARRVEETEEAIAKLKFLPLLAFAPGDEVSLSALVTVEDDAGAQHYFVSPVAGGVEVIVDGVVVRVVTPASPFGRALVGKTVGDGFELRIQREAREYELTSVE